MFVFLGAISPIQPVRPAHSLSIPPSIASTPRSNSVASLHLEDETESDELHKTTNWSEIEHRGGINMRYPGAGINMGSGGPVNMGSEGPVNMGSGGPVNMGSGGPVNMGSGGPVNMGSGGPVNMGYPGPGINMGSGGPVNMGSGGPVNMGYPGPGINMGYPGPGINMGSGGPVNMGYGGPVNGMGYGLPVNMGSGGPGISMGSVRPGVSMGYGLPVNMGSGGPGISMGSVRPGVSMGYGLPVNMGSGGPGINMGSGINMGFVRPGVSMGSVRPGINMGSGGPGVSMGSGGPGVSMGSGGPVNIGSGTTGLLFNSQPAVSSLLGGPIASTIGSSTITTTTKSLFKPLSSVSAMPLLNSGSDGKPLSLGTISTQQQHGSGTIQSSGTSTDPSRGSSLPPFLFPTSTGSLPSFSSSSNISLIPSLSTGNIVSSVSSSRQHTVVTTSHPLSTSATVLIPFASQASTTTSTKPTGSIFPPTFSVSGVGTPLLGAMTTTTTPITTTGNVKISFPTAVTATSTKLATSTVPLNTANASLSNLTPVSSSSINPLLPNPQNTVSSSTLATTCSSPDLVVPPPQYAKSFSVPSIGDKLSSSSGGFNFTANLGSSLIGSSSSSGGSTPFLFGTNAPPTTSSFSLSPSVTKPTSTLFTGFSVTNPKDTAATVTTTTTTATGQSSLLIGGLSYYVYSD